MAASLAGSESSQKGHEIRELLTGQQRIARMAVVLEEFLERAGSSVVQERRSATDSAQRRRIEFPVSHLVHQTDVEPTGGSILGSGVASVA
jgi:hypothetical protein